MSPVVSDSQIAEEARRAVARARGELVAAPGESASAPRRRIGEPSGEGGVEGRPPESFTPSGPFDQYVKLRAEELSHEGARQRVLRAFPSEEHNIARWIERARAQAEAPEPEPTAEPIIERAPDELDALELEARGKAKDAEDAEAHLSLDALGDPAAASALEAVRIDRGAAEAVLRQVDLARTERDRRAAQAVRDAAEAERRKAHEEAGKLAKRKHKEAVALDAMLAEVAKLLAAYSETWLAERRELVAAEEANTVGYPRIEITGAIQHALVEAGAPAMLVDAERLHGARFGPLAEAR